MEKIELPENWTVATLGSVSAHFESGRRPRGGVAKIKEGVLSLGGEHLHPDGTISMKNPKFVPEEFADILEHVRVKLNDILIVKDGATTGKTSLASSEFVDSVINEHLFQLRPVDGIESKFLFFFLWSSVGNDRIMKDFRGTAQGGITKSVLEVCDVPIAPTNEQHRIVEKIEKLFTGLDKGEEKIRKAHKLLSHYRQSILKDAFAGRLVPQDPEDEPASELLASIQKTRPSGAANTDDMEEGVELPPGWVLCKLGEVAELKYGKPLPTKKRNPKGKIPVYGSNGCVGYHTKALTDGPCIVVGRKGSAGAVVFSNESCWPIDTTYFINPRIKIEFRFLYFLLKSLQLESLDRSTAIPGLNREDVYASNILLPPFKEQCRIVAKIEMLFAQVDKLEEEIENAQKLTVHSRQSILKSAFTGNLVPQDINDEPANELLARIQKDNSVTNRKTQSKAKKQKTHRR